METNKKTLEEVLDLIKEKRYQLNYDVDVPEEFQANREVILSIMEHSSLDFEKLPDTVKNDKHLLLLIAKEKSYEFKNFPDWAKDDKDIVLAAIYESYDAFKHASERLRSEREVVIAAFTAQSSFDSIQHVASEELKNDIEILKLAVKGHEQAFSYIPEKWRANKELIQIVLAGKVSSSSFEHFPLEYRDNEEIAKKVINDDAGCFQYLSERLRDNRELALSAVKNRGIYLEYASPRLRDDKEFVKIALKNDTWSTLRSVSERLKNDIEIVVACVSEDNRTLSDFPEEFKDDERVIEACLKERRNSNPFNSKIYIQGSAYQYFSNRFKENRKIALKLSQGTGFNLSACPEIFKNDKEIVKNAVKESANNFEHIGSELIKDFGYLKELFNLNDGILSYMDEDLKAQLFTTKVQSVAHRSNKIIYEMVIDDGSVQNDERPVKCGCVKQEDVEIVRCDNFPVLTYEDDGPVGSYLSVRYLNNLASIGDFIFFIKENTGEETWTNRLSKGNYGPEPQTNDDFLKHEVYLIPESIKTIEFNKLEQLPRLYFGRPNNLPKGFRLFPTEESYREALTVLKQEKIYGEPKYKKINDNTLEAIPSIVDEIYGAARVYVDGFGWRFLIPHKEGALKALEILKDTSDKDDLDWIKSQVGNLSEYQKNLLKEHFGDLYK